MGIAEKSLFENLRYATMLSTTALFENLSCATMLSTAACLFVCVCACGKFLSSLLVLALRQKARLFAKAPMLARRMFPKAPPPPWMPETQRYFYIDMKWRGLVDKLHDRQSKRIPNQLLRRIIREWKQQRNLSQTCVMLAQQSLQPVALSQVNSEEVD